MASIALGMVGGAVGSQLLGATIGLGLGQFAGKMLGGYIDQTLFGKKEHLYSEGRKLSEISIQSSVWGEMIPICFGLNLLAGNIIWASPLKEHKHSFTQKIGGKGSKSKQTHTEYSYSVSIAIALCEGEITSVEKIYANGKQLALHNYNIQIYKGDEEQLPDPTLEVELGMGDTPAYRGLAYVVFDNLPLAEFGNHIPNFTFEVRRVPQIATATPRVEDMIESIIIIPGSGEFVYDTKTQYKVSADYNNSGMVRRGYKKSINQHTQQGVTNAVLSLNQLQQTLPNLKWAAPVVSWFVKGLDIANNYVMPGVEFQEGAQTEPDIWQVAGYDRSNAHAITISKRRAIYGGTPSDQSVVRYLEELKDRGYKVMFYPMIFVDQLRKPWRGRITGDASHIQHFFRHNKGYNNFILHYARLVKGKVDAFLIGSEMRDLTAIKTTDNRFPAVEELILLAAEVKKILGDGVKVSYAADWSEYHHTTDGWYNLDPLWGSPDIDFIGIDAYFPLTESKESIYNPEEIIKGWKTGEGFDFYYSDAEKTKRHPLSVEYAWKNIEWWWSNQHRNPDGTTTLWQPQAKKIWFTEYGFPSVAAATNQPNVFYDPNSIESHFPLHSSGATDFAAQRSAIYATLKHWENSGMIEQKFLWTWDARPYPYWPNLMKVWSDGEVWEKGHWVNGKLGLSTIGQVIAELGARCNIPASKLEVNNLHYQVEGLNISNQTSAKKVLELLAMAYPFYMVERDKRIVFRGEEIDSISIPEEKLSLGERGEGALTIKRLSEQNLPKTVTINYYDRHDAFRVKNVYAYEEHSRSQEKLHMNLPMLLGAGHAKQIVNRTLHNILQQRHIYILHLPMEFVHLHVGQVIELEYKSNSYQLQIRKIKVIKNRSVKIEATESLQKLIFRDDVLVSSTEQDEMISATHFEVLDIPLLTQEQDLFRIGIAAIGEGSRWEGALLEISENDKSYSPLGTVQNKAVMGTTVNALQEMRLPLLDRKSKVIVNLIEGKLKSLKWEQLLNGDNLALIGDEIIQFRYAKLLQENQYELSHLVRGKFGTEPQMNTHQESERFILLNEAVQTFELPKQYVDKQLYIRARSLNSLEESKQSFLYKAKTQRAYSPCHIKFDESLGIVKFKRRNRIEQDMRDYLDIPLEEQSYLIEAYAQDGSVEKIITQDTTYQFLEVKAIKVKVYALIPYTSL